MTATVFGLVAAMTAAAYGQPSGGRRGGRLRGSFLGLVSLEQVRTELKITEDQAAKLQEAGQKLREEARGQYMAAREIEDPQKRQAKYAELSKQFDEKARGQIAEILAQEQMIRLYQIRLQVRGAVYGLNHPFVAGRLKLNDEQKKKAADLEKATQEKTAEAISGLRDVAEDQRREKFAEVAEKLGKIRSQADEQAVGLLTAEQKEAFEKMKGAKIELQPRRRRQ